MLPTQRREKILALIREQGHAKVLDLSKRFAVTEVTIRQDLERLEREGLIVREHGGAYIKDIGIQGKSFALRNQDNISLKMSIAKRAVQFIEDGDTIILDCGSTMTEIAKMLVSHRRLRVITNGLNIALILGVNPGITVIVTGGEFQHHSLSLTGQKVADFVETIHVDKLFLAAAGVHPALGLSYPDISDICVKEAMIRAADKTFLVSDSSKISTNSFVRLGAISMIDYLITDDGIESDDLDTIRESGVKVIVTSIR